MKNQELTIHQKRVGALYERELRRAVDHLSRREEGLTLPISYCKVNKSFQTLKIYIALSTEVGGKLLEVANRRHAPVIARMLATTKKFRRIPHLVFLLDKELEQINRLEELVKDN